MDCSARLLVPATGLTVCARDCNSFRGACSVLSQCAESYAVLLLLNLLRHSHFTQIFVHFLINIGVEFYRVTVTKQGC